VAGKKPKEKSKGGPPDGLSDVAFAFRAEFGERMKTLLDLYDSRPDAAEIAGVTPEHLASYIAGRAKPPFELVARLANDKGVSLHWLATGQGRPDLGDAAGGFAMIPVTAADSSSGAGSYPMADDVREHVAFARTWLQAVIREPQNKLLIVFNRGGDNTPDIADGDAMLVVTGLTKVVDDGYYVFKPDGERMVTRRVQVRVDGRVALTTRKSEAEPEFLSSDEAARMVFARVRWRGSLL
jgi:phage repressor protein C with HTH and peptisase S24 domain